MTPRPTDSTGEFENLSDEAEELFYSSLFSDLCNTYLELAAVMPAQCCLNEIEPYIVGLFLSSLTLPIYASFYPSLDVGRTKDLEVSAMGDGVHATVSVEQPITVQDQSSQTTYYPKNGEKACPCCQFYGVPCRQVHTTEDEATTRRNQRLFSSTKRKMSHQEQLAEDSLFLDSPPVDELQTIQKRKDPECSRDTQVKTKHSMIMLMG